ncbi:MAG: hypothetical protein KDC12_13850 [Flavobacteriales bacterium]|nr:hypothetical protein [Flavobacteriales bacterium]
MGWKASLITVNNCGQTVTDDVVLKALGALKYRADGECALEECVYPNDRSVSIGRYNNCLIICDDLQLVDSALDVNPAPYEQGLGELFSQSEILSVACLSAVNFHGYSLFKSPEKIRFKCVDAESPLREWGDLITEELAIYDRAVERDGKTVWPEALKEDADVFEEDQLMEEFTFGVLKRHLGVRLDSEEGEILFFEVPFKRYVVEQWKDVPVRSSENTASAKSGSGWLWLVAAAVLLGALAFYFLG